jgi:predicted HNH restriction endonuclease
MVKYCSNRCQGLHRSNKAVLEWLNGGKAVKGAMMVMKRGVRRYLIEQAGCKCQRCGWGKKHPVDGRYLLHIHHKDGKASNSKRSNLEVLCPNCHSMTENFGTRNKQSTRYKRFFVLRKPR